MDGKPISFELYIMGASEDWASGSVDLVSGNEKWAIVPQGAYMALGVWVEPRENMRARLEWIRSHAEETEETEGDGSQQSEE